MICKNCGEEFDANKLFYSLGEINAEDAINRSFCSECYSKTSTSSESLKLYADLLSEMKNIKAELEIIHEQNNVILDLTASQKHNTPSTGAYIAPIDTKKNTSKWQIGDKVKIGQFMWLVIEINTVGEVRMLCEEDVTICAHYGEGYAHDHIQKCCESIFSKKELNMYEIECLVLPSKDDVEKAKELGMSKTDPFWVLGHNFYDDSFQFENKDYRYHGVRPILTIDIEKI